MQLLPNSTEEGGKDKAAAVSMGTATEEGNSPSASGAVRTTPNMQPVLLEMRSAGTARRLGTLLSCAALLEDNRVTFKIDTGADTSVISDGTYHKLNHLPQLASDDMDFDSPGGKLDGLGHFTALTKYKGRQYKFIIHVIKTANGSNLLGCAVAVVMGLVKRVDEIQDTSLRNRILH
ncbi:hypothetical protein ABVT39_006581 [Epinephelus coioides]